MGLVTQQTNSHSSILPFFHLTSLLKLDGMGLGRHSKTIHILPPHLTLELDGGAGWLVQDLLAGVVEAVGEPLEHHQPHEHNLRVIARHS